MAARESGNPTGKTHNRYTREFQEEAVRLWRSSGKSLRDVARELAVATESIRNWAKQIDLDAGKRKPRDA